MAEDIKKSFKSSVPLTVHWDGKIVSAVDGGPAVDRFQYWFLEMEWKSSSLYLVCQMELARSYSQCRCNNT